MDKTKRVLLNTLSQYVRTGLNVILSLYSTRLILDSLGVEDYGIYAVVAGVVAILGFVSNALVISTQRYLSFCHGQKEVSKLKIVFANSLVIHILLGVALFIILTSLTNLVTTRFLDIPLDRIEASKAVYCCVVLMISLSFVTSPFRALYVARENIIYVSIVDIINAALKLLSAILLYYVLYDKLICYSLFLVCISIFDLLVYAVFAFIKFDECHFPRKADIDFSYLKQLIAFAGWTLYNNGCTVIRTQGVAVIINKYFGIVFNASFGIAQQVSGALANVSQAIANAMSPQIIKSEGAGDRKRMLHLAGIESKYAFIMLAIVSVPILFEISFVLNLWLGKIPENSALFCRFIIIACLIDQTTTGLGIANQAIGKIRNYSLVFGTLKILTLPLSLLGLYFSTNTFVVMAVFVAIELSSALMRLLLLQKSANLNIKAFVKKYISPAVLTALVSALVCFVIMRIIDWKYRILIMYFASSIIILITVFFTMSKEEKSTILKVIKR